MGSTANTFSFGNFSFKHLSAAGDVAAGADPGDQVVQPLGKIAEYFLGGGTAVDLDIGGILELLWHPGVRRIPHQILGFLNCARHPLFLGRQHQFRAQRRQIAPPLQRHRFRHGQDQPVALDGRDHRQTDAGIAGGGFDDDAVGLEQTAPLGILDHRQADAVLDAAAGIGPLQLHPDLDLVAGEQPVDANMGRVADGCQDVIRLHCFSSRCELFRVLVRD